MAFRRVAFLASTILCVVILFFSINLGLLAMTILFVWATYQLLIKRDYTLLATTSLTGKEYQNLDKATVKRYQLVAYRVGWLFLVITILIVIIGIVINQ